MATKKDNKFPTITDDDLLNKLDQEFLASEEFKKPRIQEWHVNENMLYGKKPATLSKRANIMVNFSAGLQDSLLAKIKNPPALIFNPTEEADTEEAEKVTAFYRLDAGTNRADWEYKDLLAKKLAFPSGRAIFKTYATSAPYTHYLDLVDHYDFFIDPMTTGFDIETAKFMFQDFIYKSESDLKEDTSYDKTAVKDLLASSDKERPAVDTTNKEKSNRFAVANMDQARHAVQPDGVFRLREAYTTINGIRCYVLYSPEARLIIKKRVWSSIRPSNKWCFRSWAYYPDAFNFWSPSPLDLVRDLILTRNAVINQIVDNNEAKNKPQRFYDPAVLLHPEKAEWRPDGLVAVAKGSDPSKAVWNMTTPDLFDPKSLSDILEDLVGKITGVSAATMGGEDAGQRVGIYYGNMQEIAGRMALFDISFSRCFSQIGELYLEDLDQHLGEEEAVRMIGENGHQWGTIGKKDLKPFTITVLGGVTQAKNDAMKTKAKQDFVNSLLINQAILPLINLNKAVSFGAETAGFNDIEAAELVDKVEVDDDQLIRAAKDIQNLLTGDKFKPYLKATPAYISKLFDYLYEEELNSEQEVRFLDYLEQMKPIVIKNETNRAYGDLFKQVIVPEGIASAMDGQNQASQMVPGNQEGMAASPAPAQPDPGTMGATQAQAGVMTNMMKENYIGNQQ